MTNMNWGDAEANAAAEHFGAEMIEVELEPEELEPVEVDEDLEHTDRMAERAIWDGLADEIDG